MYKLFLDSRNRILCIIHGHQSRLHKYPSVLDLYCFVIYLDFVTILVVQIDFDLLQIASTLITTPCWKTFSMQGPTQVSSPQKISTADLTVINLCTGEHQSELLDYVAAKFHEEAGVFKLLVASPHQWQLGSCLFVIAEYSRLLTRSWHCSEWTSVEGENCQRGSKNWGNSYQGYKKFQKVFKG